MMLKIPQRNRSQRNHRSDQEDDTGYGEDPRMDLEEENTGVREMTQKVALYPTVT